MRHRPPSHAGFTAIEMLVVIGIITVLSGVSAVPLLPALRRGEVNDAASAILNLGDQARLLAMNRRSAEGYYGVVIDAGATPAYAALTYGTTATPADILMVDGRPLARREFKRGVSVHAGDDHGSATRSAGSIGWMYQYRTGFVVASASPLSSTVTTVGTPESRPGLPRALSVRSSSGAHAMAVEIYSIGLGNIREP